MLMMVIFSFTCVLCIGVMFFGWFKHLIPQLQLRMGKVSKTTNSIRYLYFDCYRSIECLVRQDQEMKRKVIMKKMVTLLR